MAPCCDGRARSAAASDAAVFVVSIADQRRARFLETVAVTEHRAAADERRDDGRFGADQRWAPLAAERVIVRVCHEGTGNQWMQVPLE